MQADWGRERLPGDIDGMENIKDFQALAGTRHLYETVLRKFVLDDANVKVESDAAVDGLVYDASQKRVTGTAVTPLVSHELRSTQNETGSTHLPLSTCPNPMPLLLHPCFQPLQYTVVFDSASSANNIVCI